MKERTLSKYFLPVHNANPMRRSSCVPTEEIVLPVSNLKTGSETESDQAVAEPETLYADGLRHFQITFARFVVEAIALCAVRPIETDTVYLIFGQNI